MKRSHNISIQLSGIKLPFQTIKNAMLTLDDRVLGVSHLEVLLGAVPTPQEVEKLLAYKGDLDNLGQVEQYFLAIIPIPRLEQRIKAFLFRSQFEANLRKVHADAEVLGSTADVLRENGSFKAVLKAVLQVGGDPCLSRKPPRSLPATRCTMRFPDEASRVRTRAGFFSALKIGSGGCN